MTRQKIISQCVLVALTTVALVFTFAIPDPELPQTAWLVLFLGSKAIGIGLFGFIFNPKAPWSARNT